MLLRNGRHPTAAHSMTLVTVHLLGKRALFETLNSGKYPKTWKSIRRFSVRSAFIRAVRSIMLLRRACDRDTCCAAKMPRAQFLRERSMSSMSV